MLDDLVRPAAQTSGWNDVDVIISLDCSRAASSYCLEAGQKDVTNSQPAASHQCLETGLLWIAATVWFCGFAAGFGLYKVTRHPPTAARRMPRTN